MLKIIDSSYENYHRSINCSFLHLLIKLYKNLFNETLIHNVLHHHALHYAFNYIKFLITFCV